MTKTLWCIGFSRDDKEIYADNWRAEVEADGISEALRIAQHDYPGGTIESVSSVHTNFALSNTYGGDWDAILETVLESESPTPGTWSEDEFLVLKFTKAMDAEGRIDPEGIANFRYLQRIWAGIPSVRFDGGRVRVRALGASPAEFVRIVDDYLDFGGPIDQATYAAVRAELGLREGVNTRVAVRDGDDKWRIVDCPVNALGNCEQELAAIGKLVPGGYSGEVIVIDAVPGFAAGCSTWSEAQCSEDHDEARAEHRNCHHEFRPAVFRKQRGGFDGIDGKSVFTHLDLIRGIKVYVTCDHDEGFMVCQCGNRSDLGRFVACDAVGNEIAPTESESWISLVRCTACDLVMDLWTVDESTRRIAAVGWARQLTQF